MINLNTKNSNFNASLNGDPGNAPVVSGERVEGRVGNALDGVGLRWFCNETKGIWTRIFDLLDPASRNNLALCSKAARSAVRQSSNQRVVIRKEDIEEGVEKIGKMLATACEPRVGNRLEIRIELSNMDSEDSFGENLLKALRENSEAQLLIARMEISVSTPDTFLKSLLELAPKAKLCFDVNTEARVEEWLEKLEKNPEYQSRIKEIEVVSKPSDNLIKLLKLVPNAMARIYIFDNMSVGKWLEKLENNPECQSLIKEIKLISSPSDDLKKLLKLTPELNRINIIEQLTRKDIDGWIEVLQDNPVAQKAVKRVHLTEGFGDSMLKLLKLIPKVELIIAGIETKESLGTLTNTLRQNKHLSGLFKWVRVHPECSKTELETLFELTPNIEELLIQSVKEAPDFTNLQKLIKLCILNVQNHSLVIDGMHHLEFLGIRDCENAKVRIKNIPNLGYLDVGSCKNTEVWIENISIEYLRCVGGEGAKLELRNMKRLEELKINRIERLKLSGLPSLQSVIVNKATSVEVESCDKLENIRIDGKRHAIEAIDAGNNEASVTQWMAFQRLVMSLRPNMKLLLPLLVFAFVFLISKSLGRSYSA